MADDNPRPAYPIIDSHIHLFPQSELDTLAWNKPSGPLYKQQSLQDYEAATGSPSSLEGFIFLETDRKNDLELGAKDGSGWQMPLMEVEWLKRIALGTPKDGEDQRLLWVSNLYHQKFPLSICLAGCCPELTPLRKAGSTSPLVFFENGLSWVNKLLVHMCDIRDNSFPYMTIVVYGDIERERERAENHGSYSRKLLPFKTLLNASSCGR